MQNTPSATERKLFGTDGVRGVANIEPMTTETAMRLGRAVAHLYHRAGHRGKIVIGKDTRLSGYMFEQAMAAGICSMGADVLLCGPLPTPGIAFITSSMRADAGIVISASHNPYQDNGIKIFAADGFKLPDAAEARIEDLMCSRELDDARPPASAVGKATRIDDARGRYIVFLKNSFPRQFTLDGFKIVVDCAHGAAYRVAPAVFQELGATVYALGDEPDGRNINDGVGALHPRGMCQAVVDLGAHVGVALDGDADRVIFADEKGRIVDGDAIMALCARRMIQRGELQQNTLVATVMSNLGLQRAIEQLGGRLVRTQVGDRYVVEEMRRSGYNLGGEQSGHLIFLDHMTTGDGIIAALQVLALMQEQNRPLSELARLMQPYPQVLVNVKVQQRRPLDQLTEVTRLLADIEGKLGVNGRVLLRYSGTEPKARVMVEGTDEATITSYAHELAEAILAACGAG
jgi:phosphoglucosamine mutase